MKISFVAIGCEQLAISMLAALATCEGHKVEVAFASRILDGHVGVLGRLFDDTHLLMKQLEEQQPDVIGFSALTMNYQIMLSVARQAKEILPNVKTIFGGVHVSAVPDRAIALPEVDFVVAGEGEIAFIEILKAIEAGGPKEAIQNTRFIDEEGNVVRGKQVGFLQDLDTLPAYDKTIWEPHIDIANRYLIMASRGCPYRCSFCFNNYFARLPEEKKGKYVRLRSVEHVMNELLYAKKRYNIKWVEFEDDVFTVYKPWTKEFLERYKNEIGVPFKCLTHPHYIDDEIIGWLKEAGCEWLQMGIQSMDEKFKYETLMRYEKSDRIEKALASANKHKLKIMVDHMFGLPGEPVEAQTKALQLYKNHSPDRIQTFWTCFLPGTDLMKQGLDEGVITQEQADAINDGKGFFFYRNADNVRDPKLVQFYGAHEILFRLMPMLPKFIQKRIKPKHIIWMPFFLLRPFIILLEIVRGLITKIPSYSVLWSMHTIAIENYVRRTLGLKRMKPTKVNDFGPMKQFIKKPGNKELEIEKVKTPA